MADRISEPLRRQQLLVHRADLVGHGAGFPTRQICRSSTFRQAGAQARIVTEPKNLVGENAKIVGRDDEAVDIVCDHLLDTGQVRNSNRLASRQILYDSPGQTFSLGHIDADVTDGNQIFGRRAVIDHADP